MYSDKCTAPLRTVGSPIRKSLYPSTYDSTRLIGVSPVLLRLLVPRHPPCALIHLTYERFKTFKTLFDEIGRASCREECKLCLCTYINIERVENSIVKVCG